MTKEILVTGGAGYIGSNVVDLLIQKKYKVVIVDNITTGNKSLIHPSAIFYKLDILDTKKLDQIFKKHSIDTVIHLAAFSSVGESELNPEKYLRNNIEASMHLLEVMVNNKCLKIIFSSSASVYGNPKYVPIDEQHPVRPISVYGKTKARVEEKLIEFDSKLGMKFLCLRYFNASGSSVDNKFGEMHSPETHLIPSILKGAKLDEEICIFGNDYDTKDGTCIRDYIHVTDIAEAHILGIDFLRKHSKSETINLGTEKGYSVQEIIDLCDKIILKPLKIVIKSRRKGDPPVLIASSLKAKEILGWRPKKNIHDIIKSAYEFEEKLAI